MAAVTAAMVKELRDQTGAGMTDCKKALSETDGNMEEAVEIRGRPQLPQPLQLALSVPASGPAHRLPDDALPRPGPAQGQDLPPQAQEHGGKGVLLILLYDVGASIHSVQFPPL